MVSRAQTLERLQFALEFFEFSNSVFDVSNVRLNCFVHDGKVASGLILQIDESAHFLEAHVQKTAVPNEMQPRQMLVRVIAVVVVQAQRRGQLSVRFVIADGFHGHTRALSQFSDAHALSFSRKNS